MLIEEYKELFTADQLKRLPLTYHFMTALQTDEVTELNFEKRFSVSKKHQTDRYPNRINYKPLSFLTINEE